MLKRFAYYILRDKLETMDEIIIFQAKEIDKLNDELLTQEDTNRALNDVLNDIKETGFVRQFKLTPNKLTVDEQKTLGKYVDTPILRLITKWFEEKADENNQLLLHSKEDHWGEKPQLFKLATLVYEDWMMLMNHCQGTFNRDQNKKES